MKVPRIALFLAECVRTHKTTGALAPSGKLLAEAICHDVPELGSGRVLEVGAGTGAISDTLIARIPPDAKATLVEINPRFVEYLEKRFRDDVKWRSKADNFNVLGGDIRELQFAESFDQVVCSIPFTILSAQAVREIFTAMITNLRPGGALTYFEYVGVRKLRTHLTCGRERARLKEIDKIVREIMKTHHTTRRHVLLNILPATVYRVEKVAS